MAVVRLAPAEGRKVLGLQEQLRVMEPVPEAVRGVGQLGVVPAHRDEVLQAVRLEHEALVQLLARVERVQVLAGLPLVRGLGPQI